MQSQSLQPGKVRRHAQARRRMTGPKHSVGARSVSSSARFAVLHAMHMTHIVRVLGARDFHALSDRLALTMGKERHVRTARTLAVLTSPDQQQRGRARMYRRPVSLSGAAYNAITLPLSWAQTSQGREGRPRAKTRAPGAPPDLAFVFGSPLSRFSRRSLPPSPLQRSPSCLR